MALKATCNECKAAKVEKYPCLKVNTTEDKELNEEVKEGWRAIQCKKCGGCWPPAAEFCDYCGIKLEQYNHTLKPDTKSRAADFNG